MTCSGEFLKIQPGTGDNLSPEDIAAGFTDYVIWNRFKPTCLDIDGEWPNAASMNPHLDPLTSLYSFRIFTHDEDNPFDSGVKPGRMRPVSKSQSGSCIVWH